VELFAAVMLFALKKFVAFWVMPFSFCMTAIVVGLWLSRSERRRRAGWRLIAAGAVLLLLASNHFVARALIRPLETRYAPLPEFRAGTPPPAALAACRFVVVLGAGNGHTPAASALLELSSSALSRLTEAVRVLRVLPDARLIVSGPSDGRHESHAAKLARAAESLGVDPARIILIDQALDTENEARLVHERVGDAPIALVTSAWHMPRSMALFRKTGANPLPCPTDFITHADDSFNFTQVLWEANALSCSSWAVYERVGRLWAWMRGKS
jgi:uncharacterized SAM-binding protein YcdF (DUF218 family)